MGERREGRSSTVVKHCDTVGEAGRLGVGLERPCLGGAFLFLQRTGEAWDGCWFFKMEVYSNNCNSSYV